MFPIQLHYSTDHVKRHSQRPHEEIINGEVEQKAIRNAVKLWELCVSSDEQVVVYNCYYSNERTHSTSNSVGKNYFFGWRLFEVGSQQARTMKFIRGCAVTIHGITEQKFPLKYEVLLQCAVIYVSIIEERERDKE